MTPVRVLWPVPWEIHSTSSQLRGGNPPRGTLQQGHLSHPASRVPHELGRRGSPQQGASSHARKCWGLALPEVALPP